jgi:hypothetical protein
VKYATVNLKKLVAEYEGAFEQFEVYLDFSDSEGIAGDCTSLTVTIREADIGSVGTFAIAGYSLDGGSTLNKYQAKQIPVTESDELFGVFAVYRLALALDVRTVWASLDGALVVVDAGDLQGVEDDVDGARNETFAVGVLDPDYEFSSRRTGEKICVKRGAQVSDVHIPRRRRSESGAYGCRIVLHCTAFHYWNYTTFFFVYLKKKL